MIRIVKTVKPEAQKRTAIFLVMALFPVIRFG